MSRNAERMQYQLDKLSYWLCVFSIVFNMVYFVSVYTNKVVAPDVTIGADVVVNIVFMLIVFLGSEKLKAYQKKWNVYVMLIGVVQILRIFFVPMHYNQMEVLIGLEHTLAVVWLSVSGILLLLAGINSSINLKVLSRYDGHRVGE
jgi:TRAP-type uncharacterized transport system fused permease subunit